VRDGLLTNPGEFLGPRQMLHCPGSSRRVGVALRDWGTASGRALVVADRVVAEKGLLDPTLAGLREARFDPVVYAEVAGEPHDGLATEAARLARTANVTAVVGVGGGSAMDLAKLVALLATNDGTARDWIGLVQPPRPVAPLALVPTTTGTGSEATRISMITIDGVKKAVSCRQFLPLVAALDPELVAGLPGPVVAATGMDALCHAIESLLSTTRTVLSATVATEAVQILTRYLPKAVDGDHSARGAVLYAAYLAGLALNAGVVLGHSLAYVIARRAPLPHGTTCAMALPYCLAYDQAAPPEVTAHVARLLTSGETDDLATAALAVQAFANQLGQPTSLAAAGILADELDAMAAECVKDYPRPNNPVPLSENRLRVLLGHMHSGDVTGAWVAMSGDADAIRGEEER